MIAIIDYKAGNLTSVKRALDSLGHESIITNDFPTIINADHIIFPGVGAAGKAMHDLKKQNLDQAINDAFHNGAPILGICLGTQIILEKSQENNTKCLGLIKGSTIKFPENFIDNNNNKLKVPHMGWNSIKLKNDHPVFYGIDSTNEFYFVHSYYPKPDEQDKILGQTSYGIEFTSAMTYKNLVAVQFHPEKSGRPGLKILNNFFKWSGQ